jgi:hypothetical protein
VQNVVVALRGRGGSLLDIGSGDGRIVLGGALGCYTTTLHTSFTLLHY